MEGAAAYVAEEKPLANDPKKVVDFIRPLIGSESQECFLVLMLNTRNRVIDVTVVTRGLVNQCQVHAREVFRPAIVANASGVILAHNHPSGDFTPSSEDLVITRMLIEAGKVLGIEVLDHVIVANGNPSYVSLRDNCLVKF
jgi:DNA repair protein RadC